MAIYIVEFTGFSIVEADSKEDALELAQDDEVMYSERNWCEPQQTEGMIT